MGSRLRRLRRSAGTGLPLVGAESSWKEDLLGLVHLARCLGFVGDAVRAEVWASKKPGHFMPGIHVRATGVEHAFTLSDVPGTVHAASAAWRAFRASVPPARDGEIFRTSQMADITLAESLCDALEAAGITIPAKRGEGTHAPRGSV